MKLIPLIISCLFVLGCSHQPSPSRQIASQVKDLSGTYLGVADYQKGHPGPNKRASRIYFAPIEGEADKYNVVLLEYVDLLKMAPSYIVSNKIPFIAKKVGFLKNITSNISAYEANPGEKENTFELWPLSVEGNKIVSKKVGQPRLLTLAPDADPTRVLEGATLSSVSDSEPKEIFFPKKGDGKKTGIQYGTAKLAYTKAKLESTWRKNFLRGPYLSQYYKKDDVVLNLTEKAEFKLNEKYAKTAPEKRMRMFTSPQSAFLKGEFSVSEPRDGMFLFHADQTDEKSKAIVEGKIGLFIDIFDATKSLNQDVVELALINTEKPEDFLMYYEHPENGEGKEAGPR